MSVGKPENVQKDYSCESTMSNPEEQPTKYTKWNSFCTTIAMVSPIASVIADLYAGVTYAMDGHVEYAILTLYFLALSTLIVHKLSRTWHIQENQNSSTIRVATMLGIVHRHWRTLQAGRKANKSRKPEDFLELYQCESDAAFLALYTSFLKSAPQLVLQIYVIIEDRKWEIKPFASALFSLVLLAVGVTLYDRDVRLYRSQRQPVSWCGVIVQGLWRLTSIASRIVATVFVVRARDCRIFLGFFLTIALLLTFMVTLKRAHPMHRMNLVEDFVHTFAVGAAFTFAFVNVYDNGHPYSLLMQQCLVYMLNVVPLSEYIREHVEIGASLNVYVALAVVLGGQVCGAFFMGIYFKWYYPDGTAFLIPYRIIHKKEGTLQGYQSLD